MGLGFENGGEEILKNNFMACDNRNPYLNSLEGKIGECFQQDFNFAGTEYKSHNLGAFAHEKSENETRITNDTESNVNQNLDEQSFGFKPVLPLASYYEPYSICGMLLPPNFSLNTVLGQQNTDQSLSQELQKKLTLSDQKNTSSSTLNIYDSNSTNFGNNHDNKQQKPRKMFSELLETLNLQSSIYKNGG